MRSLPRVAVAGAGHNRLIAVCSLARAGCIQEHRRRKPRPLELRQPGEEVQFDLKDASSVPADPEGKRQHEGFSQANSDRRMPHVASTGLMRVYLQLRS